MNTNDLIKFYGSADAARQKLGVSRQLFHIWKKNGIPLGRQARIQISTRGRIKAEKI